MSANDVGKLPGIKEAELLALGPCAVCGKKLLECADLFFYRVTIARAIWQREALQERVGLTMMFGGADVIGRIFSPDRDLAKVFAGPVNVVVHERCAGGVVHLLELMPKERDVAE